MLAPYRQSPQCRSIRLSVTAAFDRCEAKEHLMTARPARLLAYLLLLLALSAGISLASSGAAIAADGNHSPTAICLTGSSFSHPGTSHAACHSRTAQLLHCYCCGKDENGHCNHQCCD
jgi:hypothetical protein